jgi:hypothetical protein
LYSWLSHHACASRSGGTLVAIASS